MNTFKPNKKFKVREIIKIKCKSLINIIKELKIKKCNLKIDIEGLEADVLKNVNKATFDKISRIAIEVNLKTSSVCNKILKKNGFKTFIKWPLLYGENIK